MSTNLRKAQKHMQRARELLNQSQLGFGTGSTHIGGNFKEQIQGVCFMYAVLNLVLRKLYSDSALSNLKYVQDAKTKMDSGAVLRVGRNTIDKETMNLYNSIREYWSARDTWDSYQMRLKTRAPSLQPCRPPVRETIAVSSPGNTNQARECKELTSFAASLP